MTNCEPQKILISPSTLKKVIIGENIQKEFPFFEIRKSQLEMMKILMESFNQSKISLIEASTGTGKSLAYLLPSLLFAYQNKKVVVISTWTKGLQHQLLEKDLPLALKILGIDLEYTLIKGKTNYLCLKRFYEMIAHINNYGELEGFSDSFSQEFIILENWLKKTQTGDLEEIAKEKIKNIINDVKVDGDLCTHHLCPHFKQCYLSLLKEKYQKSLVLVINHSLLVSQMELEYSEIDNSILPSFQYLIIDEAHHFSKSLLIEEKGSFLGLIQNLRNVYSHSSKKGALNMLEEIFKRAKSSNLLEKRILDFIETEIKSIVAQFNQNAQFFFIPLLKFFEKKGKREKIFRIQADPSEQYSSFQETYEALKLSASLLLEALVLIQEQIENLSEDFQKEHQTKWKTLEQIQKYFDHQFFLWDMLFDPPTQNHALWIEIENVNQNIEIHYVNLDNQEFLDKTLYQKKLSISMTSATLTINKNFDFIKNQLKLQNKDILEEILPASFHYQEQCKMMVVKDMSEPSQIDSEQSSYILESIAFAKEIIQTSKGGVLILCTSFMQMELLKRGLDSLKENFPLFIQNTEPQNLLIQKFLKANNGILIGVDSFWEGIDVPGDALRVVIIMKLPFRPPNNPISQVLYEIAEKNNQNAFLTLSVPEAVIKFKQGFGRLIRSKKDRGSVICFDNRMIHKSYGHEFIKSLPTRTYFLNKEAILNSIKSFL